MKDVDDLLREAFAGNRIDTDTMPCALDYAPSEMGKEGVPPEKWSTLSIWAHELEDVHGVDAMDPHDMHTTTPNRAWVRHCLRDD
jgi:hypothetical protein